MRIRSVKPEYWRSADTAVLDMFTRLLFIGLWNYVDDNGVGEDDVHLIRSDLFPRDRNVDELSEKIHGSLTELSARGQILRYTHLDTGRDYFKVEAWQHQKISHPTASKKPLPTSDNIQLRESSVNPHGILGEPSCSDLGSKGAREQGSKGSWEQPRGPRVEPTANRLVREIISKEHPNATLSELRLQASALINQGQTETDVAEALRLWTQKNLHPKTLPSLVSDVIKSRDRPPPPAARKVNRGLELAQQLGNDNPPELTA
jgi:hypothetical protein